MGKYTATTRGRTFRWNPDFSVGAFKHKDSFSDFYDGVWDSISEQFPWDWNDYGSVQKYSTYPVIGGIFSRRMNQLEYEENVRRQKDKARNLGYDIENVRYPIHSGIYGNYGGGYNGLEVTASVIGLYTDLMRWTKW